MTERLSITEYTLLGIIWHSGPCTTYHVMRELGSSPSTFYRNRAATAYRGVQRLIDEGLVEPIGDEIGARRDRKIKVSKSGKEVLKNWLTPPLPKVEVAHSVDLIRLRMYFIALLDAPDRAALIDDAIAALQEQLATIRATMTIEEESGDRHSALATLGLVYETSARIEWLKAIRDVGPKTV